MATLEKRIEALETRRRPSIVSVCICCERCSEWLALGDHQTLCGSHPKLCPSGVSIFVTFGAAESGDEH